MFKVNIDMPRYCNECPFHVFEFLEYDFENDTYKKCIHCKLEPFMYDVALNHFLETHPNCNEYDFEENWDPTLTNREAWEKRMPDCLLIECNE